ncbi:hypothetical protein QYE76_043688 [Lolium multiflorum]|uniref:Uncharacterized protein n=1 Tax=Lolium multiflorum TaxID=4521 RepID=A0AAD8THQ0_LOLMU|nr:hypothetical protein QYE76_043688 [Lolium multiflorum]
MAMKSPPEMIPLPAGCRRRSPESPEMGFAAAASLEGFPYRGSRTASAPWTRKNGVSCVAVFGVVRILHNTLGSSSGQGQQIDLGASDEVPFEARPRGVEEGQQVGHFHDEDGTQHFLRIIFQPTLGQLQIPSTFIYRFGPIPSNIVVCSNTGCSCRMTTRKVSDDAFIDQGWAAFAITHQLKIARPVHHLQEGVHGCLPCGHLRPHMH